MPQWGRPSGAKGSMRQRRWEQEQEQAMWEQQARVEEIDSDDTDTQGVGLIHGKKRFVSDPLQFTGIDLAAENRARRGYNYDTGDSSEDSEDSEAEETSATQLELRDKEEALVQSALARIRRAQEKGKTEVKLNQEELDALEKRRQRMAAAAAKARKESGSDRGSGSERRRPESVRMSIPLAAIEEPARKKGRSRRAESSDQPPPGVNPPGFLVPGPDGAMTYAPMSYYPPQVTPKRGDTRPRSATSAQLRGTPPPYFPYPAPGNPRNFDNNRPASSASNRSSSRRPLPDEASWIPAHSRRSSVSSQSHGIDPFDYQVPSEAPSPNPQAPYLQSQPGRRYFSGPPSEVSYSNIRRTPLSTSTFASQTSSPSRRRQSSRRREEASAESSSEEEDEDHSDDLGNGVHVFVEEEPEPEPLPAPTPERERERERPAISRKPVSGGSNRQRRGKRS